MSRAILAAVLAFAVGCSERPAVQPGQPPPPPRDYGPGADELRALWQDVLRAAQRDERQRIHDLMASMMMSEDDLVALFGTARGRALWLRYKPMVTRLVNTGSIELVAQVIERKLDEIEVLPVDGTLSPADRALVAALPPGTAVYHVRVKHKGQKLGLRYEFFIHRNGRWLTGNQIAKHLVEDAAARGVIPPVPGGATSGNTAGESARPPAAGPTLPVPSSGQTPTAAGAKAATTPGAQTPTAAGAKASGPPSAPSPR